MLRSFWFKILIWYFYLLSQVNIWLHLISFWRSIFCFCSGSSLDHWVIQSNSMESLRFQQNSKALLFCNVMTVLKYSTFQYFFVGRNSRQNKQHSFDSIKSITSIKAYFSWKKNFRCHKSSIITTFQHTVRRHATVDWCDFVFSSRQNRWTLSSVRRRDRSLASGPVSWVTKLSNHFQNSTTFLWAKESLVWALRSRFVSVGETSASSRVALQEVRSRRDQ